MPSLPLVKKLPAVRLSLFEQLDFTEKQTANFIAQCKAHKISPTFALNALCMVAYHRGVLGSPAKSEKFVTNITIDLRRALPKCSLSESALCHFSSGAYANTTINKDIGKYHHNTLDNCIFDLILHSVRCLEFGSSIIQELHFERKDGYSCDSFPVARFIFFV